MVKYQYIIIVILYFYACQSPDWQTQEQKKFKQECIELGLTIERCNCILHCLELEYENYNIAFDSIVLDTVSTQANTCVQGCNKDVAQTK